MPVDPNKLDVVASYSWLVSDSAAASVLMVARSVGLAEARIDCVTDGETFESGAPGAVSTAKAPAAAVLFMVPMR